ncbi:hypothetical protein NMY22_g10024 [Coprinellus aureogranulatus]|nr:hypothetical protein NMY22_g10024 [Coprinellus aureogranulatus]
MSNVVNNPDPGLASSDGRPFIPAPSLRIVALRMLVAFTLVMFAFAIYVFSKEPTEPSYIIAFVMTLFTALHHIGTAFGPPLSIPIGVVDIILTFIELFGFLAANAFYAHKVERIKDRFAGAGLRYQTRFFLVAFVGGWLVFLSLLSIFIVKVIDMVGLKDKGGRRPRMYERMSSDGKVQQAGPWYTYGASSLLGATIWSQSVPGESNWLAWIRGALAAIAVCVITAFGLYFAIIAPISELGMTPYRQYRANSLPQGFASLNNGGWNMVVVWNTHQHPGATGNLTDAVTVTRLITAQPPCTVKNVEVKALKSAKYPREVVEARCASVTGIADVILQVNYTNIVGTSSPWNWDVVTVYFGLPEKEGQVDNIVANTHPIYLFRGNNLVAVTDIQYRQALKPAEIGTLGFEMTETFLIANIKQILPSSRAVDPDPLVSTLRFAPDDFTQDFNIVQDYRDKTVLAGLASVGGLATTFSTFLIILFGTSLMRSVIRSRPYSPFGVFHKIESVKRNMIVARNARYAALKKELDRQKTNPGVSAYLFDTLIDLDALDTKNELVVAAVSAAGQGHGGTGETTPRKDDDGESGHDVGRGSQGEQPLIKQG